MPGGTTLIIKSLDLLTAQLEKGKIFFKFLKKGLFEINIDFAYLVEIFNRK